MGPLQLARMGPLQLVAERLDCTMSARTVGSVSRGGRLAGWLAGAVGLSMAPMTRTSRGVSV
eukprot:362350-Chlamydomonas_euryale.AAC.4